MSLISNPVQWASRRLAHKTPINPVRSKLTRPIASISFDDIPETAATTGAPILEHAGVRGTFYICGGHAGGDFEGRPQFDASHLKALHRAGHEIGCHSYDHPDVARLSDAERLKDLEANVTFLRDTLGDVQFSSFAYPYGAVSFGAKLFYSRQFLTCRGVYRGVNAGLMDFSDLRGVGLEVRQHDMSRVADHIAEAKETNGWLIFFSHDVSNDPSPYGCRPKDLEAVIEALKAADIEILPVKAGAARALFGEG